MSSMGLIETGATVCLGRESFTVGRFIPELNAWDLWQGEERTMTVRADIVADLTKADAAIGTVRQEWADFVD